MFRSRLNLRRRWILSLAAVLFVVVQLGAVTHSLHLDGGSNVELACGFCATSHASMDGPQHAPPLVVDFVAIDVSDIDGSVLVSFDFPSSARARAPPAS
jgi:hypothetical protein